MFAIFETEKISHKRYEIQACFLYLFNIDNLPWTEIANLANMAFFNQTRPLFPDSPLLYFEIRPRHFYTEPDIEMLLKN